MSLIKFYAVDYFNKITGLHPRIKFIPRIFKRWFSYKQKKGDINPRINHYFLTGNPCIYFLVVGRPGCLSCPISLRYLLKKSRSKDSWLITDSDIFFFDEAL